MTADEAAQSVALALHELDARERRCGLPSLAEGPYTPGQRLSEVTWRLEHARALIHEGLDPTQVLTVAGAHLLAWIIAADAAAQVNVTAGADDREAA